MQTFHISQIEIERTIYQDALEIASGELQRIDDDMRGKHASVVPSALRVRRVQVCQAIDALKRLVALPGTH